MSRAWIQQPERGSRAALRLIGWIALHMGRRVARVLLFPIVLYFLLTGRKARLASRAYLRRALGREPGLSDTARHLHCFAATILDRVYLLADQTDRFDVRVNGGEVILDRLRDGRGCILLGAHLGSFEVLRAMAVAHQHFTLRVLMYREHNRVLTELLDMINPQIADTVIPLGGPDALLRAQATLAGGGVVGMLGDRVAGSDKTTCATLLGSQAVFPAGPALVAAALGVPVVLCFGLYRGGNRYDLHFELLAERITIGRSRRDEELRMWTQRYADRLEHYARLAPYNWFNFYDYWNDFTPAT